MDGWQNWQHSRRRSYSQKVLEDCWDWQTPRYASWNVLSKLMLNSRRGFRYYSWPSRSEDTLGQCTHPSFAKAARRCSDRKRVGEPRKGTQSSCFTNRTSFQHLWQTQFLYEKTSLASRAIDGLRDKQTREEVHASLMKYFEADTIWYICVL